MIFIAIVVLVVLILRFPKIKGIIGELYVAAFLKILPNDKYSVINNLLFTWNGHSTQIDHIVVSIYGIFVIETKYYKGLIYGGENSEYWLQNIYGNKHQFRNPILQNQGHIRALKHLLHEYEDLPSYLLSHSLLERLFTSKRNPQSYTSINYIAQLERIETR